MPRGVMIGSYLVRVILLSYSSAARLLSPEWGKWCECAFFRCGEVRGGLSIGMVARGREQQFMVTRGFFFRWGRVRAVDISFAVISWIFQRG